MQNIPRMTRLFKSLLLATGVVSSINCWATDAYNPSNNQLTIPSVQVGTTVYSDVVITVANVLSIGAGPALGIVDIYNSSKGQLTIPSVAVGNTNYFNVVINVGNILAVGSSTSTVTGNYVLESTTITQNTYPDTFNNVTTLPAVDDTCLESAVSVQYPASYRGAFALPAKPSGQTLSNLQLGFTIKDNWNYADNAIQDNPNLNAGCNTSNRTAFQYTLTRLKAIGALYVDVAQFICLPSASNPGIAIDASAQSISDEDLAWMGQQAKSAGLKIRLNMQICGGDQFGKPLNILDANWLNQLFSTYQTYMLHEAQIAQSAGFEAMSLDWTDWSPDFTNYATTRDSFLVTLSTNIRKIYKGKLWLYNTWIQPSTALLNSVDLLVLNISTPYPAVTASQNTNLSVGMLKLGYDNFFNSYYSKFGSKPAMVVMQIQSHSTYFLTGWIEDAGCYGFGTCASTLTTDFSVQAIGYEAALEVIHDMTYPITLDSVNISSYWLSDTLTPHNSFPNTSQSVRNKPAEAIIYNWFKK